MIFSEVDELAAGALAIDGLLGQLRRGPTCPDGTGVAIDEFVGRFNVVGESSDVICGVTEIALCALPFRLVAWGLRATLRLLSDRGR